MVYAQHDINKSWADPYYSSFSSLRRDPKRNSTCTFHLAREFGKTDAQGRPAAGVDSFHLGPGVRLIGGELTYAYTDRGAGKVKIQKSPDPREILNEFTAQQRAQSVPPGAARSYGSSQQHSHHHGSQQEQQQRQSTHGRKAVFWDGTNHHIVDAPEGYSSTTRARATAFNGSTGSVHMKAPQPGGGDEGQALFKPRHVEHKDLVPGRFLGVVETPGGEGISLVAGKHRLMPDSEGSQPGTGTATGGSGSGITGRLEAQDPELNAYGTIGGGATGRSIPTTCITTGGSGRFASLGFGAAPGLSAELTARRSMVDSLRAYAPHKLMGHKEYEATCRAMEGVSCWDRTQCNLDTSMRIGQPTRLMSPQEHMNTTLSLRRPATSRF